MTQSRPVRLSDYTPPPWLVDDVHLTISLAPSATRVKSRISFRPNPERMGTGFHLDGEDLDTQSVRIDGVEVTPVVEGTRLSLDVPDRAFVFEAEVLIDPAANTKLEGLYMSNGMYCTQCEAEGFRRITWYPDRPDVMAPFTVRVEGDLPVLLSNGDPIASGPGWAEWHDPWPKPAYLFALVAGDLVATRDSFTTMEGRAVDLAVWTRPGDETKTEYALDALKRSMRWDEQVYGRAYDLSQFNIVAVDDFNAGAMENKGLNIFNSAYVLARPDIATDRDYELIESVVAHEYFHNWTGNRITCRDWFQLCLKEGLTVFRDQQFSGDMRSHAVKRIDDVLTLRSAQFTEDAGPLAHPVRPESYHEINNFYTATVYEKGAEVIRILRTFIGADAYDQALALYFQRHDGEACTIEDWIKVFEDSTGRDLGQWMRWYSQAGTPRLAVEDSYDAGTYSLTLSQRTPPTPGQIEKAPQVIPVALGLIGADGSEVLPTTVVTLEGETGTFTWDDIAERPVLSVLRDFSAPVIVERDVSETDRLHLLAHDTDPVARWEAGRQALKLTLVGAVTENDAPSSVLLDALDRLAADEATDPAFRAFALALPSEEDTAQTLNDAGLTPDPVAIRSAHRSTEAAIAARLSETAARLFDTMHDAGPYSPDADAAGRRALRLRALRFLTIADGPARAEALFQAADNMTDRLSALSALLHTGHGSDEATRFREDWQHEKLVMDKWIALVVSHADPEVAVDHAQTLLADDAFDFTNPNSFRRLVGAVAGTPAIFHRPDGAGYAFVGDRLIALDPTNPQTAARMATFFETWRRYDADRQDMIADTLSRIAAQPNLSTDMAEIIGRIRDG